MSFPLNPAQSEAVRRTDVPMLVLAGAGSGKTRVITAKIAHLVAQGTDPSRVVAITFTNKAAREMRERANALLGASGRRDDAARVRIATFHALGLSGILNATLRAGGTVLLLPKFDTQKVLETIQAEGATHIHGVPTMYHSLLNHPTLATFDTSTLAFCGSAGAAIAAEIIDQVEKTFGVQILEMYGLTESGPVATINMPRDRKPYSIGKAIPGVDIEIWDEQKKRLPRGKLSIGEIMIRGHNTMSGYLNNPEATAAAFTDGWLHTGDLAWMDEDGFLFFADRKKELIIRGGYNVYPREVEEVLYTNPKVSEAAVVGVPDERLGEEIKAYLTLKPGEEGTPEEFIDYVKERLAAYKYPRIVEVIAEMPKSATGKILKKELAHRR